MNRRMVFYILGRIIMFEALIMVLPLIVSAIYAESCFWAFLITIGITLFLSFALQKLSNPSNKIIYAKEGLVVVALAWMVMSALGALPFVISREIPSYIDAVFETVSGFTTTGSSILTDVEALSHGSLFWRSFTHWIGGMGVLVFIMAIVPSLCDRSIHILRAEVPGPVVGKLVPRIKKTAKILYLIYIVLTAIEVIFLLCGGMSLFESLVHAFGTAGTGGFTIKSDGLASYSPYIQWVITIFMLIFGVNFNIYYYIIIRRFSSAIKSGELWCYLLTFLAASGLITLNLSLMQTPLYDTLGETVRHAAFQISSIMTTTGYATTDFNMWPEFSQTIILILMFMGACAGSTAGGLKVSRVIMLFKIIKRELHRMAHPHSVSAVRFEGKTLDETTTKAVNSYFALYMVLLLSGFLLLSIEPNFDIKSNFSAIVSCINNIGPGLNLVGPTSNFSTYSDFSKIILSLAMLIGRLEIYPMMFALMPSTWTRKVS